MSEPAERVVVLTMTAENAERYLDRFIPEGAIHNSEQAELRDALRKALEQPQGEVRYRIVWSAGGTEFFGPERATLMFAQLDREEKERANGGEYGHMVAIDRQVCGPWTDIDQQEGDE